MVPGIAVRVARYSRWGPVSVLSVPHIPLVAARNSAFVAKDKAHVVEKLIDVKLKSLREPEIISIEVNVVGEVVQPGNGRLIIVGHAL